MSYFRCLLCLMIILILATGLYADDITYQGNKARISVGNIKDKASGISAQEASAVGEMLSTALVNTGKYIVLASQEEVGELIDEIDLGQSGYVEEGRGADKGLMEGADILITGAVTGFEPDAGGSGGGFGGLTKKAFGKVGIEKKTAEMMLELKIIDIRTRRIIKAFSIDAKSSKWKTSARGATWTKDIALGGALGVYSNEPMEKALREVIRKTVEKVSKTIPDEYYRYQGGGQYTSEYGGQPAQASAGTGAAAPSASSSASNLQSSSAPAVATTAVAENMKLYTRYDFVPGDKVIFYDDMKDEEEAEFPYRWNLIRGVYEVARMGGEFWILATDNGEIKPKMPLAPLPEQYTVELEFYNNGPDYSGNYFYIYWIDKDERVIGECGIYGRNATWLSINGKTLADKTLPAKLEKGSHFLRIMASKRSIKMYVDEVRVANVPKVENFNPYGFKLRHRPYNDLDNPTLFRGFRFAEGGKSMKDQLDESGRIVTHGILFDVNSHKIKGESYKTLKEIGELLTENPELRLSIEGHTDSDGSDDSNAELSRKRAESVKVYLMNEFSIPGDRLEAKGWGESKPMADNTTSEGRATNRRVELIKL